MSIGIKFRLKVVTMHLHKIIQPASVIFFIAIALLSAFAFFYFFDTAPATKNAIVIARIRPVSSQVDGLVQKIYVKNNQYVKKGQKLFSLNPTQYEYAVQKAKAQLKRAIYQYKSLLMKIKNQTIIVKEMKLELEKASYNANKAQKLKRLGAEAKSEAFLLMKQKQITQAKYQAAQLQQKVSELDTQAAKEQVTVLEKDLKQSQLSLKRTTIYALTNGSISNLNIGIGAVISAGTPLFSFVDTNQWWVEANIKETQLGHVRPGQKAIISLPLYPNHTFSGTVTQTAWAASRQQTDKRTSLPIVASENQWFLLPQRFPVLIKFNHPDFNKYPLHVGASASVKILTNHE